MALKAICSFLSSEKKMIVPIDWIFYVLSFSPLTCGHLITKCHSFWVWMSMSSSGGGQVLISDWIWFWDICFNICLLFSDSGRSLQAHPHRTRPRTQMSQPSSGERDSMIKKYNRAFIFFNVLASQGHSDSALKPRSIEVKCLGSNNQLLWKFIMLITIDELFLMACKYLSTLRYCYTFVYL